MLGKVNGQLRNPKNQKKYCVPFVVIDEDYTPFLGASLVQKMGLISVQHENILIVNNETTVKSDYIGLIMREVTTTHNDVFKGLGCMEGALHLEVDKSVAPTITPPRHVPLTIKNRLKEEVTPWRKPV